MTQNNVDFTVDPSGAQLLDDLMTEERKNFRSSNAGETRPVYAVQCTIWVDTSNVPWALKIYDGADDIIMGYINPNTNTYDAVTVNHPSLAGNNTFTGTNGFTGSVSVPTVALNLNNTSPVNTAYINNKFKVVDSLPTNRDDNTFYFVRES